MAAAVLARKAGSDKRVHPRHLLHSYAIALERQSLAVTEISALLGHGSIAVTVSYLGHLTNGDAIAALDGFSLLGVMKRRQPTDHPQRSPRGQRLRKAITLTIGTAALPSAGVPRCPGRWHESD
jgi:hypothetical protein